MDTRYVANVEYHTKSMSPPLDYFYFYYFLVGAVTGLWLNIIIFDLRQAVAGRQPKLLF